MAEIIDLFAKAVRESGRIQRSNALDHIGRIHSPEPRAVQPCPECEQNNWRIFAYPQVVIGYCADPDCEGVLIVDRAVEKS